MPLPSPEPGLVISYSYLWRREHAAGREEGLKSRPCVVVLAVELAEVGLKVTVVPVTQTPPDVPAHAVQLPPAVKQHLGLDDHPSWVILDESNQFGWPGYDLRPLHDAPHRYHYGLLPPRLFATLTERFRAIGDAAEYPAVPRS